MDERDGVQLEQEPDLADATEPTLVVATPEGEVCDVPGIRACGRAAHTIAPLDPSELIPMPYGSQLYLLPGRRPAGCDGAEGSLPEGAVAVAAFLPPRYTALWLAAYERAADAPQLPLYCYAAVCWYRGEFYVAAVQVDEDPKHDPQMFLPHVLRRYIKRMRKQYPQNRLVAHLADRCALRYGCANAMNFFYRRWEMPVPVAPACNAACVGCISAQPDAPVPSPQERLDFVPEVSEIVEIAVPHLENAPGAMVSFGQGCEGEPLLWAELIAEAIQAIRARTDRGTIHLNTNGSRPEALRRLCAAGLDSVRISMNSVYRPWYERYYRPVSYSFDDVVESFRVAHEHGCFVSLNYLTFPGVTDSAVEVDAFRAFLDRIPLQMVQWRNLNIDPDVYVHLLELDRDLPAIGLKCWIERLRAERPTLRHGYLNPPRELWAGGRWADVFRSSA